LQDVALHAAVAAESSRLTRDLQDSREHLLLAREEERRRLRRDLHDGLGPSLAGMAMQISAVRRQLHDLRTVEILGAVARDLSECKLEVRRLVDQLRPPSLDEGLETALRRECTRFTNAELTVELHLDAHLDDLPAAIEVAAYRVVSEALTNVTRHARASTCRVTVVRAADLAIEVVDDGRGITGGIAHGVGLRSMRERAAELGGRCTVGSLVPHGTRVRLSLPLPTPRPGARTTAAPTSPG
jgi:signal transduction histidine kinase